MAKVIPDRDPVAAFLLDIFFTKNYEIQSYCLTQKNTNTVTLTKSRTVELLISIFLEQQKNYDDIVKIFLGKSQQEIWDSRLFFVFSLPK